MDEIDHISMKEFDFHLNLLGTILTLKYDSQYIKN